MIRSLVAALGITSSLLMCSGDVKAQERDLSSHKVLELNFDSPLEKGIIYDISGKNNHAYVKGAKWKESEGNNGAYEFDGRADEIFVKDSDNLSPSTTGQFAVAFWAKFGATKFVGEGTNKDYINFFGKGDKENHEFLFRQYNDSNVDARENRVSFYVFSPVGGQGAGSYFQESIDRNNWMFIVGMYDGLTTQIWKNGTWKDSDLTSPYNIHMENGNAPLRIGTYHGEKHWKGSIDSVRIWDRVLTGDEVKYLYDSEKEYFK